MDMLRSLDCMYWGWKNRPTNYTGQYIGKESEPAIGFEAVVSRDLWFWHAFSVCLDHTTTSTC